MQIKSVFDSFSVILADFVAFSLFPVIWLVPRVACFFHLLAFQPFSAVSAFWSSFPTFSLFPVILAVFDFSWFFVYSPLFSPFIGIFLTFWRFPRLSWFSAFVTVFCEETEVVGARNLFSAFWLPFHIADRFSSAALSRRGETIDDKVSAMFTSGSFYRSGSQNSLKISQNARKMSQNGPKKQLNLLSAKSNELEFM